MVFVEGGIFECWDESGIKSQLYELSDFYIDTRLVSYRQFSRFAKGQSGLNDDWERHRLASASDDWPVRGVTWEDAQKFAESLAQGRPGRERWSLPLDIQWQLVATNRSVCLQPWSLHVQRANSSDYLRTGSPDYLPCLPNPLGVYDLGNGNLREWVYDWFASRPEDRWFLKRGPLSALSSSKPRTRNYSGPITGKQRSVRGGHFSDPGGPADWFRSSAHPARTPAEFNGFRAVWILE
jgi:formylglycine-generating enzyme required for sulfatase activity